MIPRSRTASALTHPLPGMQSVYGDDLAEAVERFTEASVDLTKDIPTDIVHCHDWMTYEAGTRTARTKGKTARRAYPCHGAGPNAFFPERMDF